MAELVLAGEIWQRTANALAGYPIRVYIGVPEVIGAAGEFRRLADGGQVILKPQDDQQLFFLLFLHEVSHALHDISPPAPATYQYESQSVEYTPEYWAGYPELPTERVANELAKFWFIVGFRRAGGEKYAVHFALEALCELYENDPEAREALRDLLQRVR